MRQPHSSFRPVASPLTTAPVPQHGPRRRGSALMIVVVLLGMLAVLGFLLYTLAAQERSNAAYFAESEKYAGAVLDADTLFDWALEQLIVGPADGLTKSALYSQTSVDPATSPNFNSRHALLPNMLGQDLQPYSGAGIHLGSNNGQPFVDLDYDGTSTETSGLGQSPLDFNDSAPANGATPRDVSSWPDPSIDYTYPDINNLFLAFDTVAHDANGNPFRVVIPSFHRPQYLRNAAGPIASWWDDALTGGKVMRPHPLHQVSSGQPMYPGTGVTGGTRGPFPFMPGVSGNQGVWTMTAPPAPGTIPTYEWDIDNDGDGVKEGVYLNLDYAMQTDAAGRKFVPLFSYTVYDADALFNVNVHGNDAVAQTMTAPGIGAILTQSEPISASNQGLHPSEINPQYALNAEPAVGPDFTGTASELSTALLQYQYMFGSAPITRTMMSNLDWYRIMTGAGQFADATTLSSTLAGRYGESALLNATLSAAIAGTGAASNASPSDMPAAGLSNVDDNFNLFEGLASWQERSYLAQGYSFNPGYANYFAPRAFGLPLDFNGDGRSLELSSGGKSLERIPFTRATFPEFFSYDNYGATPPGDTVQAGWRADSLQGQQMRNRLGVPILPGGALGTPTGDEAAELVAEPASSNSNDSLFGEEETAALQLVASDRTSLGLSSRVRTLASFNLQSSSRADEIAKNFVASSWDRKNFGYAGVDSVSSTVRSWELTSGTSFPPTFAGTDPFRDPVRRILSLQLDNGAVASQRQLRLSFNQIADVNTAGESILRDLTPHDATMTAASTAPTTQEQLARIDRQRLARDIYVLLYLLGGGLDNVAQLGAAGNPLGASGYLGDNAGRNIYSDRQLAEMAQFAVNVVDSRDEDQELTRFEYDKNLGNGWNLNDQPWDDDGVADRGVVDGVETQELVFSEGLLIRQQMNWSDNTLTPQVENNGGTNEYFTFLELENISTRHIPLATPSSTTPAQGAWRIVADTTTPTTLTFQTAAAPIINAGQASCIASTSFATNTSDFRIDYDNTTPSDGRSRYNLIVPNRIPTVLKDMNNEPYADLDLRYTSHATQFDLGGAPALVNDMNFTATNTTLKFRLERRANLNLVSLSEAYNPWVQVDEIELTVRPFNIEDSQTSFDPVVVNATGQGKLEDVVSQERAEPFSGGLTDFSAGSLNGFPAYPADTDTSATDDQVRRNSIGYLSGTRINKESPNEYVRLQFVPDRPFANFAEVFEVPLCAPADLTRLWRGAGLSAFQQYDAVVDPFYNNQPSMPPEVRDRVPYTITAGAKFLSPKSPLNYTSLTGAALTSASAHLDNRWYRLLEVVEIPTRTHRQLGNPLKILRKPGQLNLNTLRDPSVLAGLLDDPETSVFQPASTGVNYLSPVDPVDQAIQRDWWRQFLQARDARQFIDGAGTLTRTTDNITGLFLPGLADSVPFRSFGFTRLTRQTLRSTADDTINQTVFRPLPLDVNAGSADPRHLFEVGSAADHQSTVGTEVGPGLRHRLLGKVTNLSTVRSHVFLVYISVDFFEADDSLGPDQIQIGGKYDDMPGHRGFFVVDRSAAEQAYDEANGTWDFRKLVRYRRTIF